MTPVLKQLTKIYLFIFCSGSSSRNKGNKTKRFDEKKSTKKKIAARNKKKIVVSNKFVTNRLEKLRGKCPLQNSKIGALYSFLLIDQRQKQPCFKVSFFLLFGLLNKCFN